MSEVYFWRISVAPETRDESIERDFVGTQKDADQLADEMADSAPFEVADCILERRGLAPTAAAEK